MPCLGYDSTSHHHPEIVPAQAGMSATQADAPPGH